MTTTSPLDMNLKSSVLPLSPDGMLPIEREAGPMDFFSLLKPRVSSLVVFTAFAGIMAAPVAMHPLMIFITLLCVALSSGASGAINMWYEHKTDALMTRTKKRPIPMGKISPEAALAFGIVVNIFAVMIMGLMIHAMAAFWLLVASLFYIFIYTIWLKKRTPQNIVIGGAAGAFPPIIGWVAATGHLDLFPFLMFLIIFLWTPPHFWALALFRNEDYTKAGIPMLPVTHGFDVTRTQIIFYTILTIIASFSPVYFGMTGLLYFIVAIVLNAAFLIFAMRLYIKKDERSSIQLFTFSIFYLFALFLGIILEHLFTLPSIRFI
jgi:protoheme IX farnesyltransferase